MSFDVIFRTKGITRYDNWAITQWKPLNVITLGTGIFAYQMIAITYDFCLHLFSVIGPLKCDYHIHQADNTVPTNTIHSFEEEICIIKQLQTFLDNIETFAEKITLCSRRARDLTYLLGRNKFGQTKFFWQSEIKVMTENLAPFLLLLSLSLSFSLSLCACVCVCVLVRSLNHKQAAFITT